MVGDLKDLAVDGGGGDEFGGFGVRIVVDLEVVFFPEVVEFGVIFVSIFDALAISHIMNGNYMYTISDSI